MYTERDYNNSLCHYGIKGQTWGNRRFQNMDGSYTALGERHRLEQLARTGVSVRPSSALANREQTARTGNTVRVNPTARKATSTSTGSGTTSTVRRAATPAYGSISTIQSVRGKNSTLIAQAAKKKAEQNLQEATRTVNAKLAESRSSSAKTASTSNSTTKTKKSSSSSSDASTTGTTRTKKKSSTKSKKQRQQEAAAKKRQQEAAKTEESKNNEENKDESEDLSDEQVQDLARRVIRGEFGNGQVRKDKLGANYAKVQALVNQILLKGKRK